jgi:hypothetical protein
MDYVIAALLVVVIVLVLDWRSWSRDTKLRAAIQSLCDELLSERGGGKDIATQLYKPGALVEVLGHLHNLHNNLFWSRASVGTSEEEINRPNGTLVEIKTAMNRMNQNVLDIPIRLASLRSKPKPAPRKARKGVKK